MSGRPPAQALAASMYRRAYLVGRCVAGGWTPAELRRAMATRMRGGRARNEADWGVLDGLADTLIDRGEAPCRWRPVRDSADPFIRPPPPRRRPRSSPRAIAGVLAAWLAARIGLLRPRR